MKLKIYISIIVLLNTIIFSSIGQPLASVNPDSLATTIINCNDSVEVPITIYNTGTSNLTYNILESFNTAPTGYCTPTTGYCCPDGCGDGDYIRNFTFNTISNLNSNCNGQAEGYISYPSTSFTTNVLPDGTYNISMQAGSYSEGFGVWIDYNRDGDFDDANEFVYSSPSASTSLFTSTVTIPSSASYGKTKLRVRCSYSSLVTATDICNEFYYSETEDYEITIGTPFISAIPNIGTIAPGDSAIVQVKFNSTGMYAGNYLNYLIINTNDTLNPIFTIPCYLTFIGVPEIAISANNLDFGSIMQGATKIDSFLVSNLGCGDLNISDITNSNSDYSVNSTSFTIPQGESQYIIVTFNPQSLGDFYDTLNIINNDTNLTVSLYGYATSPPVMSWSPNSIDVTINTCNDSVVLPLTIYNTGNYVLNYTIQNQQLLSALCTPLTTGYCCDMGIINVSFNTINKPSPNGAEGYKDFSATSFTAVIPGQTYTISVKTGVQYNEHVRAWIDYNNNQIFETNERILESINKYINHSAIVTIPLNAVIQTPLRMRVMSEYSGYSSPQPCNNVQYGQCEDYAVIIGDYLSLSNTFGTVLPNDSNIINLTFHTESILAGTYTNNIVFNSNDPLHLTDSISYTLNYNGYPIISSSVNCLEFDSILQFNSNTDSMWLYNIGCDSLYITDITNTNAAFVTDNTFFNIYPGDSAKLYVTFNPTTVGDVYDTLSIINDDSLITICLHGYAFAPPIISYSPDSIDVSLTQCNDSITIPLTIYNIGDTTLTFNLSENIGGSALKFDGSNDYVDLGNWFNYQTFTIEMWVYPGATQNQYADIFDNNHTGSRSFVLQQNSTSTNQYGWGTNDGGSGSLFSLTPNQWSHIAVTRDGSTKTNKVYVNGTLVSNFVGTVNIPYDGTQYFRLCRWGGGSRYWNGTMDDVRVWNEAKTQQQIQERMNRQLYGSEAGLIAYWNLNEGSGITANDLSGSNHTATINNGAIWSTNRAALNSFIITDTLSGSIVSADSSIINVTISSTDLITGDYNSSIIINSNDPLSSSDTINVNLHFTGYPLISSSVNCLLFDSIIQYSSFTDSLWFTNNGCDTLTISDITFNTASFSIDTNYIQILPKDSSLLNVTFIPNIVGDIFDTLHIINNDVDINICLQGYGFSPPIISHSPDSIVAIINTCNDSLTVPVTIYNIGDYDLIYSINNSTILPAQCTPITTNYCCDMGIKNVKFNTIDNTTSNGSEGYKNFTATQQTRVLPGQTYNLYAKTGVSYNEHVLAWIDYNNNGTFETSEKILESINQYINHSANVTIPTNAVENTPLRMRIISDYYWNAVPQPCNNVEYGQCEDYTVMIGNKITLSNNVDTVVQNDSSIVNITFYTDELLSGSYTGNILILSNDPLNPIDSVKFDLILNGYPVISLSDSCLELDSIIQYNSKVDSIWVYNTGCDTLKVTALNSLTSYFYADTTSFNILPNDSMQIFITFNPNIAGHIYDTLEILNNDTTLHVCLHGYAISPPIISHSPDSIVAIINTCNDSLTVPVTIYNIGDFDLIYSINNTSILPALCTPVTTGTCCSMGIYNFKFNTIDNTTGNATQGYNDYSATQKTRVTPGQTYNIYARTGTSYNEHVNAWIDYNNNQIFESSEQVLQSVNTYINHSANVTIPLNAVENTPLRMRIGSEYSGYVAPQPCNNVTYGQFEDYSIMVGSKITLSNNADTIAQNDSSMINITFHTDELLSGSYTGNILISSNDPLNPIDSIKFDLILNGYPVISLSDSCLEFDSIMQYNSKVDSTWVYNIGCDTLKVTALNTLTSYFYTDTTSFNILPNDSMQIFITFNPNITGHIYDTLEILNNDTILHVCLHGFAISPPIISYSPDSIDVIINVCNDSIIFPLTIYNVGDTDLVYEVYENGGDGMFTAEYFYSAGTGSSPAFGTFVYSVKEQFISHEWGGSGPGNGVGNDDFQVKWKGSINCETNGTYNFRSYSDDGVLLYIDGQLVINYWFDQGSTSRTGSIYLNKGIHELEFQYYENGGGANAYLYWTQPSQAEQLIPAALIGNTSLINSINDTILSGDSVIINVTFYSSQLITGVYNSEIIINSNDPLSPVDTIFATIEYNGYPVVSLSDTCLVFDTIVQWDNNNQSFYVYNTGCDTLFVSNVTSDLPEFTTTDTLFTLLPNDSALVSVNFAPVTVNNFNGTLSIISNTTTKTLCLTGVSIVPPQISFNPATLTANITACNDTFTTPLTIYNSGDYQLIYSIGSSTIQSPLCMPTTTAYCCGMGITRFTLNTINYVTSDGNDGYSDYSSFMQTQLTPSQTYPITVRTGNTYTENVRVWIDFNNNGTFDASEKVFESLNQMLNHVGNITIPANSVLQTPLRLRVGSDLGTNAIPQPCTNVEYGQFEDYTVIIGSGISFTNSSDTIPSGDSAIVNVNLDATVTTSGTYSYSVVINSNDPLSPVVEVPFDIVIAPLPAQPVVTDEAICFGATTPDLVATGTNVDWFSDGTLTTNIFSGNTYNNGETTVGQYPYYVTQTINNCQGISDTITLSINPVYNLSDAQSICNGDSYIFGTQTLTTSGIYIETFQTVNSCDSVVTLTLTVNPTYSEVDIQTICNGNSYIFGTQTLTTSGIYVETFPTVNGCDSVVTLTFTVYPTYNVTDSTSITCGGSYTFGTQTLTTAGIYVETFNTINSCDSVVTLTLYMIPTYSVIDVVTICNGDVFVFGTQNLTIAGIYTETFTAQDGCDSLVTLTLNVNPVFATTDSASITCGNSYTFGTQTLTIAGIYNETFTAVNACDSVVTLTLYMIPSYTTTDSVAICNGDSYTFGTQTLSANGVYNETFTAGDGCDSLVTLTLYIKPTFSSLDAATICNGDSYTLGTQTLTVAGAYVETFTAVNGCDSVVYFSLSVNPTYNLTDSTAICNGDSYVFGTQTLTSAGVYVETFSSINGCDSVVTLTLTINPIFNELDTTTICNGDVFVFGTQNLTIAGNYAETFSSVYGCDSVVTLTLNINPTFATNDTAIICNGDNFVFGTQTLTIAGNYVETFTAINGCDSVVTLTLNVNPIYSEAVSSSITCGASYILGTQTLTSAGIYSETFASINGCDSVVTLTLSMLPSYTSLDSAIICNGDSYIFGTQTLTIAGVYNETFTALDGCDSLVTFTLTVNPTYNVSDNTSICDGDSYTFGTQTLTASGVYVETFTTINGCDSVVTLTFTVNSTYNTTDSTAICNGNSFTFGTQTLTIAGVYVETFSSVNGCDSVVTLTLSVNPVYSETDSATICDGDSYIFGTQTLSIAGVYSETFSTVNGCDSVVSLTLFVNPVYSELDTASITCGATYIFGTQTLTIAGNYIETFSSINGCDSVVTLTLQMLPSYITNDNADICDGNTLVFGSQNLTLAGNYSETFTALTDGCDSLVNLTLNVNPSYNLPINASICDGDSYILGTQTLTVDGVYNETFTSVLGCDSIVTLTLTVNVSTSSTTNITACDSYSWIDGNTYTSSNNTATVTLTNSAGCDSVVTLNLTINVSTSSITNITACNSYIWLANSTTYTTSGTYTATLTNAAGCDSIATLNLTINVSTSSTTNITACDSYTWSANSATYIISGAYTATLINAAGCDSIATLNLTINNSNSVSENIIACDSYTWSANSTTYTSSGTYTDTLTNFANCDSVVTLNLTINFSTSSATSITACDSYTWSANSTTYTTSGTYIATLINVEGCDSVIILNLTINPVYSDSIEASITCGGTYTLGSQILDTAGVYTEIFQTTNSCDSTITLTLSMIPEFTITDSATICSNDSIWFGNQYLTLSGVYNYTFIALDGCDSLVTFTLNQNPVYSTLIEDTISCGDTLDFEGQLITSSGYYSHFYSTTLGCDSVINLDLFMIPAFTVYDSATICNGDSYIFGTQTLTSAGTYNETFIASTNCDSLVVLTLNVNPNYLISNNADICSGDSVNFAGLILTTSGVYYDSLLTVQGCDSVLMLNLNVKPLSYSSISDSIACGGSYNFNGNILTSAGTYNDTLVAANGCDSIITLNLSMIPSFVTTDSGIICDGDVYQFGTQTLTIAGVYNETFTAINGCDSLVSLTLTVKPTPQTALLDSISCGETYSFAGLTLSVAGTYYDTLLAVNGCDSIVTLYLAMRPSFITPLTATICDGEEYQFGIDTLTIQGIYNHTLTAINGCDSLVTLTLTVTSLPATPIVADISKCTGSVFPTFATMGTNVNWYADSLFVTLLNTGNSFTPADSVAGTYNYYVTQTANGCTSLYETATLQIYQTPSAPISSDAGVCFGNVNPILFASGTNICWYSDMLLTDTLTVGNAYQPTDIAVGSYFYYITQRSDFCGVSNYTIVTFVISNPPAAPQANDVTVCYGDLVPTLTVLQPSTNVSWYSEPELVILVNTGTSFITGQTAVGETTYYITQNISGCISSVGNVTLTINPIPLVTLDKYYVNINKGDSVTITAFNADNYTWSPVEGLNISTGSEVIAKPEISTTYVVTATNTNGCTDSASCFVEVGQISVEETTFAQSVLVYPNPANQQITVNYKTSGREEITIRIYNALNQIIYSKEAVTQNGELVEIIKLENLPDAIYNLQIIRNNSVVNTKVVVKH